MLSGCLGWEPATGHLAVNLRVQEEFLANWLHLWVGVVEE